MECMIENESLKEKANLHTLNKIMRFERAHSYLIEEEKSGF
jgi:hypothetical protein